jgi:hypothetical protein
MSVEILAIILLWCDGCGSFRCGNDSGITIRQPIRNDRGLRGENSKLVPWIEAARTCGNCQLASMEEISILVVADSDVV